MNHPGILLEVSAFSGLAGALLSQVITALNGFFTDKRKYRTERRNAYFSKRNEVGENFYFIHGEVMAVIKKNTAVWQNRCSAQSQAGIEALNTEVTKFMAYLDKLYAENWKYNLTALYFPVTFTAAEMLEANQRSQRYRVAVLDLATAITDAPAAERGNLYEKYAVLIFEMCSHYENLYNRMEQDRMIVKNELLRDFLTTG